MIKGKNILIVSPQNWDGLKVSKHHYALELSKDNTVFFLQPPTRKLGNSHEIKTIANGVLLVDHKLNFPYNLLFHWLWMYNFLMRLHVRKLMKKLNTQFDICWSFDGHLYNNLNMFNAKVNIYHPVDFFHTINEFGVAKDAHLILSVTEYILQKFNNLNVPKFFINHGLCDEFANLEPSINPNSDKLNVCYIGNVASIPIDHTTFKHIIENNQKINFNIIGDIGTNNSEFINSFIEFLRNAKNVNLFPTKAKKELGELMSKMDVFLICYNLKNDPNNGTNSHKILEYLAHGKVVLSSRLSIFIEKYSEMKDLVIMMEERENLHYVEKFQEIVENIEKHNNIENQKNRIRFANNFTYKKQIEKIGKLIEESTQHKL